MRTLKIKRVIALATLLIASGLTGLGYTNDSPSSESIAFAQRTSDLMLNELLAALFQEFNETTPNNVEEGKQAISLIFNDSNIERLGNRWYYRRSVALSNAFHPACVLCHTNFTPQFFQKTNNPGQWVGALTLRVPIKNEQ